MGYFLFKMGVFTFTMMKLLGVDKEQTRKTMHKQDKDRAKMAKDFFNRDINDPLAYDAVLNTDSIFQEDMAAIVVDLLVKKSTAGSHKPNP